MITLAAGFETSGPGFQLNRFCGSGLEAVNIAAAKVLINGFHGSTGDGMQAFVARADELADKCGSRFRPSARLRERAGRTELF